MRKRALSLLSAALLACTLQAATAPNFTLKSLEGPNFKLADHVGKQVIVVDFWATWCGPCTKYLKKLQELKSGHPDVLVLAISIDDGQSQAQVSQYIRGRGFDFKVLLDPEGSVCRMFNPSSSVPYTVVIDRNGDIAYTHSGYLPGDEKTLAAKIEGLRK